LFEQLRKNSLQYSGLISDQIINTAPMLFVEFLRAGIAAYHDRERCYLTEKRAPIGQDDGKLILHIIFNGGGWRRLTKMSVEEIDASLAARKDIIRVLFIAQEQMM
jgi:hypothetical protein